MSFCTVETATIVFATLLSVLSATTASAGLTGILYLVGCIVFGIFTNDYYQLFGILAIILNVSAVSLLFCITLIRGVKKRNSKLVWAYLVYGCLVTIVAVLLTIAEFIWFHGQDPEILITMVTLILYHCIMLVLVLKTYLKIQRSSYSSDRHQLICNQLLFLDQQAKGLAGNRIAFIS